jgi:hypothetical protein
VSDCYVTDPVETSVCTEMFIGVLCARSASLVLCDTVSDKHCDLLQDRPVLSSWRTSHDKQTATVFITAKMS